MSKKNLSTFFKDDCLDKDILIILSKLTSKILDLQIYQCYNVATLSSKNKRI